MIKYNTIFFAHIFNIVTMQRSENSLEMVSIPHSLECEEDETVLGFKCLLIGQDIETRLISF